MNKTDILSFDLTTFIRVLEIAREEFKSDDALHKFVENAVKQSQQSSGAMDMNDLNKILALKEAKMYDRFKDTWPEGHSRSRFNADGTRKDGTSKKPKIIATGLEVWKNAVKKEYPEVASKLKFKLKGKAGEDQEISAEVEGQDRCYGFFNIKKNHGEVLGESMNKDIMKAYLEALEPSEFDAQAEILNEGFLDWFKKNENEGKVKVYRLTPEAVKKAAKDEDTPKGIDFSIKDDVYAIGNDSPIVDELITILGVPRDGTPYKIRTGYMTYVQKMRLLVFAKNKYDLPGFIGRRPK